MTPEEINALKLQYVDVQHDLEVKMAEVPALQVALQNGAEALALKAKQKEIQDLRKALFDLKKQIYG